MNVDDRVALSDERVESMVDSVGRQLLRTVAKKFNEAYLPRIVQAGRVESRNLSLLRLSEAPPPSRRLTLNKLHRAGGFLALLLNAQAQS